MKDAVVDVLLVEDNAEEAALIMGALAGAFLVQRESCLADAMASLEKKHFAAILLDLSLPDAAVNQVFEQVFKVAGDAVILVLCSVEGEGRALLAVQNGADDYFVKEQVNAHWLPRTLGYLLERKASRLALLLSEARFRAMSDASPLGIFVADASGNCLYSNAAYHRISGFNLEQTLGTHWSLAIHPEDRERVLQEWQAAVLAQSSFQSEARFLRVGSATVWTRLNAAAMNEGGQLRGYVLTVEDVSERKAVENSLFEEKERAQVTLNSIGDAVLTTTLRGAVSYLNPVAEKMTGWSWENAKGRPLAEVLTIIDGGTREIAMNPAEQAISGNHTVALAPNSMLRRRDGVETAIEDSTSPIHDHDGLVAGAVIVFRDVSAARAMALKMAHLAQHDFLTGLPNRALLSERLSWAIAQARRHSRRIALLFFDLDYFKQINDSLGHAIGDKLLQLVATRLQGCIRDTDTLCRQGGDEFVILLAEIDQAQDAMPFAEKLLATFAEPCVVDGNKLLLTLSIGIGIYPDDGQDADSVMKSADTAMYYAKANGRNNFQFFTPAMNARVVQHQQVEGRLRRALDKAEFMLDYQPRIDLASGLMVACEAGIRWQDPAQGLIDPQLFMPIAEESGLIVPIGNWRRREVCRQIRAWLDAGWLLLPVVVKIFTLEFRHKNFLDGLALMLKEFAIPPGSLALEVSESVLMHDAELSASTLASLKDMGIQLALADFGMGCSSLRDLKRFAIPSLKIDPSFVREIAINADDKDMLAAMVGMGKSLKCQVVADGVETPEQRALLRNMQCDQGQGPLFGAPLLAETFSHLLLKP